MRDDDTLRDYYYSRLYGEAPIDPRAFLHANGRPYYFGTGDMFRDIAGDPFENKVVDLDIPTVKVDGVALDVERGRFRVLGQNVTDAEFRVLSAVALLGVTE
jgi:hypothetical protein